MITSFNNKFLILGDLEYSEILEQTPENMKYLDELRAGKQLSQSLQSSQNLDDQVLDNNMDATSDDMKFSSSDSKVANRITNNEDVKKAEGIQMVCICIYCMEICCTSFLRVIRQNIYL